MIYLRARFYDPAMNRFSQKDALRGNINNPLSLNKYLYCENDPVNFVDSIGRAKTSATSYAPVNQNATFKTTTSTTFSLLASTSTQKAQTAARQAAMFSNEAMLMYTYNASLKEFIRGEDELR